MKIESGRGVGGANGAKRAGQTAAPGFAPSADAAPKVAASSSAGAVTSLDAILALQGEEPPAQRRARQAKRGKTVLDKLQDLERAIALGRAPETLRAELETLRRQAEPTGEEGLDGVLLEIDTRLAVELAKLERMAGRA